MRIALFSDIHANLPALNAFFESVDKRQPDVIYCLGDLVGYNVWPNEVITAIRDRNIATIAGNHDLKIRKSYLEEGKTVQDLGKDYAYEIISDEGKVYLKNLPAHIRLEFQLNNEKLVLLMVHGSPKSVNEYLLQEMEEAAIAAQLNDAGADILCFGHSHKPYHRIVPVSGEAVTRYKHAVNIGSVGKPKDGDPRGCYVLLHINENTSVLDPESVGVEFIRFDYDIERAARAVIDSPLPDEFAEKLRTAQ
ncbi:metallophosphatase family protein [Chitinophaga filiformis]|uniref:metallophosphoesterase family protein n=1 Tax=Chitinophaga filiformis TaxID=104663 RepID=UPI001F2ED89D|nr:metallophosphoesterase family protein [Chitinophaga filiformis]MCF6406259.1 metallophosphatase family protein [Chitinophaga filiformis]